jgi:2-iminobutanoate/2-iminopropanoate deaminase
MKAEIERITSENAPPAGGHYSPAVRHGDQIYVSGQLPVGLDGSASFAEQAALVIKSMLALIDAAGGSRETVLMVTAYIVGIEHWPEFNRVFAEHFGDAKPARAVIPVPALHYGYLIEISAVAAAA